MGGRKSPFPLTLAIGLYNSLYYRTSRDKLKPINILNLFAKTFSMTGYRQFSKPSAPRVLLQKVNILLLDSLTVLYHPFYFSTFIPQLHWHISHLYYWRLPHLAVHSQWPDLRPIKGAVYAYSRRQNAHSIYVADDFKIKHFEKCINKTAYLWTCFEWNRCITHRHSVCTEWCRALQMPNQELKHRNEQHCQSTTQDNCIKTNNADKIYKVGQKYTPPRINCIQ